MEASKSTGSHAIVFGASGLAGWGVVDQLLENYPSKGTFSKVTAVVNRPLSVADSFWPISSPPERPKLELVSVNLAEGSIEQFTELLKGKLEDVENITHAFYFALKPDDNSDMEVTINLGMIERAIGALDRLSPKLSFVVVPSGTKGYGIHVPGGVFTAPYKESMVEIPAPYNNIHYYAFHKFLAELSKGKKWTWCDVRPDAIVGFVPNGSAFNLTAHWANYLSVYAHVEGRGAKVPYPGSENGFKSLYNEASSDIIAKFSIWAALHAEKTRGQIFNIADQAKPSSMVERWPALAAYFGLEGVGPSDDPSVLKPGEYVAKHREVLEKNGIKGNPVFKGHFLDTYGWYLSFDRQMSLDKARSVGFTEEIDPNSS